MKLPKTIYVYVNEDGDPPFLGQGDTIQDCMTYPGEEKIVGEYTLVQRFKAKCVVEVECVKSK